MVRGAVALMVAMVLLLSAGPAAAQEPSPTGSPGPGQEPVVGDALPGEPQCTITDYRLREISGMVATDDGYIVVNDSTDFFDRKAIFFLGRDCQVVDLIPLPDQRDPEALALDRERNILWVGDIGDNLNDRQTVALFRVELAGDRFPVIHRFAYPDGPRDAEALILDGDGTPIIVTKRLATAELFRPAGPMVPNNPHEQAVPLEKVGEFPLVDTGTEHRLGPPARMVVTDGANSPDGSKVVLRSYTDAYEFDVVDGDVVGAITGGTPMITPLPGEPLGEAISYTPDGAFFVTVSDMQGESDEAPVILRYAPAEPPPPPPPEETTDAPKRSRSLLDRLGPRGILNIIGGIGVVGLLLVVAGVVGIVRARRAGDDDEDDEDDDDEDDDDEDDDGGYAAPAPAAGRVAARARVPAPPPTPPAPTGPEHADGASPGGTVYTSGGSGYPDYPFDQDLPIGYPPPDGYPPAEGYPPAAGYPGAGGYGAAGGDDHRAAGYPPDGYAAGARHVGPDRFPEGGYPDEGHAGGEVYRSGYREHPQHHPPADGGYGAPAYQASQPDPGDFDDDDPDYRYEFRQRDEW